MPGMLSPCCREVGESSAPVAAKSTRGQLPWVICWRMWPHRTLALQPLFPFIDHKAPAPVRKPAQIMTGDGPVLMWTAPKYKTEMDRPIRYVIYRFAKGEKADISDGSHIVGLTANTWFTLVPETGSNQYVYAVTALDRLQNESHPVTLKVKL